MQHRLVKLLGAPAPWLMGVVNVTPDSFSDGGQHLAPDDAVAHGRQLLADGAHLLDLGGEFDRTRQPPDHRRAGAGPAGAGGAGTGARGDALDRHLPCGHRRTLHRAGCGHRQRRLRLARRPRHGRGDPRPQAGPGHDARQGRAAAARHRPAGPLCRSGPRRGRLALRPGRCRPGGGHRGRPDRARPRLGQVPEPGARP